MFKEGDKVKLIDNYMGSHKLSNGEIKWIHEEFKRLGYRDFYVVDSCSLNVLTLVGGMYFLTPEAFTKYYIDWLDELPIGE